MFSLSPCKSLDLRGEFLYSYSCSYQCSYSSVPSARVRYPFGKQKDENVKLKATESPPKSHRCAIVVAYLPVTCYMITVEKTK